MPRISNRGHTRKGLCRCFRRDQHLVGGGLKTGSNGPFVTKCGQCRSQRDRDKPLREYAGGTELLDRGYAYTKGTVGTDPSIPLEDAEVTLSSAVLAYVRTLDLWGRSGKFDVILP
jgi:hypothetical protein